MTNEQNFLKDARLLAEVYGIKNLFIVVDGYSTINNNGNEAIRRCRETLENYEREIGSNPEESWV